MECDKFKINQLSIEKQKGKQIKKKRETMAFYNVRIVRTPTTF